MSGTGPDLGTLSSEEKAALISDLRRELRSAQSEVRLLKRRLADGHRAGDATEGALRARLRAAAPHPRTTTSAQASMKLGRRFRPWKSPALTGLVAVLLIALAVDAGVGWYQARSLQTRRQAKLQLESSVLTALYVELRRIAYEPDGKSYRMTVLMQNNNPAVPLFVMLNPAAVYVQTGMSWRQVPSKPVDTVSSGVVKVIDDFSYDVLFAPDVAVWTELIPGYMHVRIQNDMLVSQRAQPGDDVVERRTPFYVYLKPHGADDDDIKKRSQMSGTPPIFIPMPPH